MGSQQQQSSIIDYLLGPNNSKKRKGDETMDEDENARHQLQALLTDLATIKPTVEDTNTVVKSLQQSQAAIKEDVKKNSARIDDLATRVNAIDQRQYEAMIEISGVKTELLNAHKNNISSYARDIVNKLPSVNLTPSQIEFAYIRSFATKGIQRSVIVVKFCNKTLRSKIMEEKRKTKSSDGVFFEEVLTSTNRALKFEARQLKKNGKLCHVWIRDGIICVRKSEGSPVIKIRTPDDLIKAISP